MKHVTLDYLWRNDWCFCLLDGSLKAHSIAVNWSFYWFNASSELKLIALFADRPQPQTASMKGEPVFGSMNILPNFRITDVRKEDKITNWNVRTSFLPSNNLPLLGIDVDHLKKSHSRSQSIIKHNTRTLPPPNDRYINNNYSVSNPSPLGNLVR